MRQVHKGSVDQQRWNLSGIDRIKEIESDPEGHIISKCPIRHLEAFEEIIALLNPIEGKKILELGCGKGDLSVWLAKKGAQVTAIDIGSDLVAAGRMLAKVNHVYCEFQQGNISELPFDPTGYDIVIGLAILHHLSEDDVIKAMRECCRVLTTSGIAIFLEPIENSRLFDFAQNLLPAGHRGEFYRPSILQRSEWKDYLEARDDRAMTSKELISAGSEQFRTIRISHYGLLVRLVRLIGSGSRDMLQKLDRFLFQFFPMLKYYSQSVLVVYHK